MASVPFEGIPSLILTLHILSEDDTGRSSTREEALETIIDLADQARNAPSCKRRQYELLTQVIAEAAVLRLRHECPRPRYCDTSRRDLRAMMCIARALASAYRATAPKGKVHAGMIMEDLDDVDRRARGQADAQEPELSLDEALRIMSGLPRWDAE